MGDRTPPNLPIYLSHGEYSHMTHARSLYKLVHSRHGASQPASPAILPHSPDSIAFETTINHLPCLRACVLKSLRLFPPLTPYLPKRCPAAGATLPDGTHIPGGTEVAVSFVAL